MAFIGDGAWQEGQTLTFGSASSITWTGIPTDAKFIRLVFQNVTINNGTTPHIAMRFGNGGTPDSAGNYDWRLKDLDGTTQGNNGTSDIRITHTSHGATAHRWYGIIDVHCIDNEHTNVSIQSWSKYTSTNNHVEYGAGRWTVGSDLDRIMLFKPSGHNYTGGRGTVYYLA